MSVNNFSESTIEQAALDWMKSVGWQPVASRSPTDLNRGTLQHALTVLRVLDAERIAGRCA